MGTAPPDDLGPLRGWLARQSPPVHLELACSEHPDPTPGSRKVTVVRLPRCTAGVAPHLLLELLLVGAATVRVRRDGCGQPEVTTAHIARLAAVLAAGGQADRLSIADVAGASGPLHRRPVLEARTMPVARRRLLLLPEPEPRALPEEHHTTQERLVAAVRALVPSLADEADREPGPGAALQASGCTACGICVRGCPEDALRLEEEAEPLSAIARGTATHALSHLPARCADSGECVQLCPVDALLRTGSSGWTALLDDRPVALARVATTACARCRAIIPAADAPVCAPCEHRRQNPFRTALPPGLADRLDAATLTRLRGGAG